MALKSLTGEMAHKAAPRFWAKLLMGECWLWTASKHPDGYGMMGIGRKLFRANRISWVLHNGAIPDGLHVLHRCDNRDCCNPDHLFLGTHAENMKDMADKGRARPVAQKGENNPQSKLTSQEVATIRASYVPRKVRMRDLALKYGVCTQTICNIVHGSRWRNGS